MASYKHSNIYPHEIDATGMVTFTDGKKTGLFANRQTCEAYGYTFHAASGTCRINQQFNASLEREFNQETNRVGGSLNDIGSEVRNSLINGSGNVINSQAKNGLITGRENSIESRVNNSFVMGVNGKARRNSELVIGGGYNKEDYDCGEGLAGSIYTDKQMSFVKLSGVTCNRSTVDLTINGEDSKYITIKNNSIVGYEVYITRLELGGTSGTAGNYTYSHSQGVVQIDNAYAMTFSTLSTRNINSIGGNHGTIIMHDTSDALTKSFSIRVSDRVSVVNSWSASVYLHEIVSTVTTF
tara:strand:+ start:5050 stop:5940 length:891 start_codon:yes stop_codon:yes gene_type:complete